MNILLVIDSFKGCLSSEIIEKNIAEVFSQISSDISVDSIPISDGGEGFLDAIASFVPTEEVSLSVHGLMMEPLNTKYLMSEQTAFIEVAKVCGLSLLPPEKRNVLSATTYGVGEVLLDAVKRGAKNIIVGLGGTATSDCGRGMLMAIEDMLIERGQSSNLQAIKNFFLDINIIAACDVQNVLYGKNGAAHVFAAQKGANLNEIEILDERARDFAELVYVSLQQDCSNNKGAGAAGGLGFALMAFMDASYISGFELLFELGKIDKKIVMADCVITGEGSADSQTLMGKLPLQVLRKAQKRKLPVYLVCGQCKEKQIFINEGFKDVFLINEGYLNDDYLMPEVAIENIKKTISRRGAEILASIDVKK